MNWIQGLKKKRKEKKVDLRTGSHFSSFPSHVQKKDSTYGLVNVSCRYSDKAFDHKK